MSEKRKLKKFDKKIQKKQIKQRKEKLSKLTTEELMAKRKGINPKSESKADYMKRRKSELKKPSPAKIVPILGAIAKAALAAGKVAKGVGAVAKGIKAGATLAKGVKAVGTAQKIGKGVKVATKIAKTAKSVIDRTGGTPPPREKMADKGMQKFASMDFAKASPATLMGPGPSPLKPRSKDSGVIAQPKKNFDASSAFKMKGFGGFGNKPSPAKLSAVAKIGIKAGVKAVKTIKKAYKNYKAKNTIDVDGGKYGGYARKVDMENAIKRRKVGTRTN